MEDKQSASQRPTQGRNASNNEATNRQLIISSSSQSDGQVLDSGKSAEVLVQELLHVLHKLTEEKPQKGRVKRLTTHPMTLLVVGFVLSGVVGSLVTFFYTRKAQEVAATRSFSDEFHKLRIHKVAEVWERLDQDEATIERLVNELSDNNAGDKATENAKLQQLEKLIETDKEIIGQHRFWLGQQTYDKIHRYLDATIFLLTRKILEPEADVGSLLKARDTARSDIEVERLKFLNSETVGLPSRCYLF